MLCSKKIFLIIISIFLLILFSYNFFEKAYAENLIDLNLKGVDLRDALRTIAEIGGVNLIADESVKGSITIKLENISFEEALKLISKSKGLGWHYKDNTFFVADEKRIDEIFSDFIIKKIKINNRNSKDIEMIITSLYPEVNFSVDNKNDFLILRGKNDILKEIKNIIYFLDEEYLIKHRDVNKFTFIDVKKEEIEDIVMTIKLLFPEKEIIVLKNTSKILISGNKNNNKELLKIINEFYPKNKEKNFYKYSFKLGENTFNEIKNIINDYDKINSSYEKNNNMLYIEGKKEDINFLINIINEFKEYKDELYLVENKKVNYLNCNYIENMAKEIFPDLKIYSDNKRSLMTIKGKNEKVKSFSSLVDKMDKPRLQVMIEAQIIEISFRYLKEFGVNPGDLSQINIISKDKLSLDYDWPDIIKLLKEKGNAKVLASPTLLTIEGEKAELLIGDKIPMKISGEESEKIKYIEAGIKLSFLPILTDKKEIILSVNPKVNSIGEIIGDSFPTINTREVNTKVRLNNKEFFVIAGLIQEDIIQSESKIPVLGDIPVFGSLFRSYNQNNRQTEVIIMLRPHIIDKSTKDSNNSSTTEGKYRSNIEEYNVWK